MTETATVQPPTSNRGANYPPGTLNWDWYSATLAPVSDVLSLLSGLLGACGGSGWAADQPRHGYSTSYKLEGVETGSVVVMLREADTHVQATSRAAVAAAAYLREVYPSHGVSRADVAYDADGPDAFEQMWSAVHAQAREGASGGGRKVSTSTAGDWIDAEKGRTFYAGGTGSRMRVVVYEKGLEQLGKDPACGASRTAVRAEWRIRPDTPELKRWASTATPAEVLGMTAFGAACAARLLGLGLTVPAVAQQFASQDPLYWMCRAYGKQVLKLLELDPFDAVALLAATYERSRVIQPATP